MATNPDLTPSPGQPRGLATLFLAEMWERFSFYGMKAQLTLFLIAATTAGGLGWSREQAGTLMAWYAGLVYLAPMFGGWMADRFLGTHRCLVIGGAIIASGHFVLLFDSVPTLFIGLGLVILGTGFFKSNVSTMVGQLYKPGDSRRDAGFTIFYMGINLGAFIAPLLCGWLQVFIGARYNASLGWRIGFMTAGVGMVAGLTQYLLSRQKTLAGIGESPKPRHQIAADHPDHQPLTPQERGRVLAIFVVAFFVVFFFSAFEQSGTSMAFFADKYTDRSIPASLAWIVGGAPAPGSATFPAGWFQSVNPVLILTLAPVFALAWPRLARRNLEPSTPVKMGIGLIVLGLGFLFMVWAGGIADRGGLAPAWLLIAALLVHTCGELCLSPVGLSLVTKLAPARMASMLMGVWFLAAFAGNFIAGKAAAQFDSFASSSGVFGGLRGFYLIFTVAPIAAGLVLLAVSRWVRRLMGNA